MKSLLVLSALLVGAVPTPTDTHFAEQTNLHAVGVDAVAAWETTQGRGAKVCLLDDGVDWFHRELVNAYALNAGEFPAAITAGADGVLGLEDFPGGVTDVNANGIADTQDLILSYSDGVDDDGNGFVDDLAGWDFDDDDNDPYDLWENGHGSGRAGILAARIDGVGSVGLAPEAKLLAARVGDKILHAADTLGQAVVYCADMGADSINMSLGAAGASSFLRESFRYAAAKGVVSAGASGNEGHYHHEFNASFDDVISVGSVIEDASPEGMWTEKNNTTDYGAKLQLAAPTDSWTIRPFTRVENRVEGGTSSATPHVAAGAALLRQAARDANIALSGAEARQLLQATAVDIRGTKWGAVPGWDAFTGYGRVNFGRAIAALHAGEIPPTANLRTPEWYEVVRGDAKVSVDAALDSRRGASVKYVLEWGTGVTPPTWTEIKSASVKVPFSGSLAELDAATLTTVRVAPLGELQNPQSYAVTLRLRIDDGALKAEDRQTFFVDGDPEQRAGFPKLMPASFEAAFVAADLDADGRDEIIVADGDGVVRALRGDGSSLWEAHTSPYAMHLTAPGYAAGGLDPKYDPVLGSPAAADLDGDGKLEIVVPGLNGTLHAFKADGSPLWPAPVTTDYSRYPGEKRTRARLYTAVVLADLDGDGKREIITGAQDQQLYAWHADGSRVAGFPVFLAVGVTLDDVASGAYKPAPIAGIPAVGDLDGDGRLDIVMGTDEIHRAFVGRVYAVDRYGRPLAGWPVPTLVAPFGLPVIGEGVSGGVTLADLEGDGKLEVIGGGFSGVGAIWNADGSLRTTLARNHAAFGRFHSSGEPLVAGWTNPLATVADLDGDGAPEIYAAALGLGSLADMSLSEKRAAGAVPDAKHLIMGWNADGDSLDYFPRRIEGWAILTNPLVVDVDGDARPELVVGSSGYYLHAYRNDGSEPPGWPKFTGGWLFATPAAADVDGDGRVSIFTGTREGQLFAWKTAGRTTDARYAQMRGTADRAGRIDSFAPLPVVPETQGCGCGSAPGEGVDPLWMLLGLAALWRLRPSKP